MKYIIFLLLINPVYAGTYVSIAGNKVDHDNIEYSIDGRSSTLLSIGYRTNHPVFFFGEITASGTSSGSGVSAGIGIDMNGIELSGGIGQSKEEAVIESNGTFTDSSDDKYEYEFLEVSVSNVYLRASKYNVNYNFKNGSFADDRQAIQLGYRLFF